MTVAVFGSRGLAGLVAAVLPVSDTRNGSCRKRDASDDSCRKSDNSNSSSDGT